MRPSRVSPLSGGCVAEVVRAELPDGSRVVVKLGGAGEGNLDLEGWMLEYLARESSLPVPRVLHCASDLLVMEHIETTGGIDASVERHAAELLAELHGVPRPSFGFERDTLIGSLAQPNPRTSRWVEFFGRHRLMAMGREALAHGGIGSRTMSGLDRLVERLDRFIAEPAHPSLLHGDVWAGNVLTRDGRVAALIDPAIYFGHPEIELAFTTLFGTFGRSFFDRYAALRGVERGFFESRRDIYNLYPLLVHARLFGGGYGAQLDSTLRRLGV